MGIKKLLEQAANLAEGNDDFEFRDELRAAAESMGEPVAWRCKGFAEDDEWVVFEAGGMTRDYLESTGCLMEPLYLAPPAPAVPVDLARIHDQLLMLSGYPEDYPMRALLQHLSKLQMEFAEILEAAPEPGKEPK